MRLRRLQPWIGVIASVLLTSGCGLFGSNPPPSHTVRNTSSSVVTNRPTFGETYVVARGDTLFSIAFRNQLDYHELADWNGIGRDYAIRPGQVLRLTPPDSAGLPQVSVSTSPAPASASAARSSRPSSVAAAPPPSAAVVPPIAIAPRATPSAPSASIIAGSAGWEWPTRGKILRSFDGSSNKGLDIGGDVGQIVVASRSGKVVYSGSALKGYGELIIIKHDEDTLSAYGYNRRRLVEEGDSVVGGQPIAELGLGPEQRPLLHFEIRDHGKPVDPKPLLPGR